MLVLPVLCALPLLLWLVLPPLVLPLLCLLPLLLWLLAWVQRRGAATLHTARR